MHKLGKLTKTHGYHGTIILSSEQFLDDEVEDIDEIFIEIDGLLVPFPVETFELNTDTSARLKLEFVDSVEAAATMLGCDVYAEVEVHEQEAGLEQWIGFDVYDAHHGYVGIIQQIENFNGNIVLQITHDDKETLLSLFPELITSIDSAKNMMYISAPEGYF